MRCKSTHFYINDQIFLVLLRLQTAYLLLYMKRYIKHLGIAVVIIGLLLFVVHVVLHIHGNVVLFSGLLLVLGGIILFVKGESAASIHSFNGKKDKK